MATEETGSPFVRQLADAPTLEALPQIADPLDHAPLNPPARIQQKFVGSSYLAAYSEAERFVDKAFEQWPAGDAALQTVLDFGSGWGRITRMLLRRFRADQIWSSDVDSEMSVLLQGTLPGVNAVTNAPWPPSIFREGTFDAITAFSVFSHLSEDAHRQWAAEFARVTHPGSRVFITVLEDEFLAVVAGAQAAVAAGEADLFAQRLALVVPDAVVSVEAARRGEFVYAGGGADDDGPRSRSFYAWAVAPRPWVESVWGQAGFTLESWVPQGELFDQAMVVLVRTDAPAGGAPEVPPEPQRNLFVRAVRKGGRILSRIGD
ncbi:class I SAM-dependent methyltransferase [Herbiconiux daphne]|uniref:Class I SAM-dependent methyltransferase n=1 Tax=Herbiconiux daphne TaxID=2970914 RepID=A0ABT2H8H6_9MICO|nr:class I SAM-dependent methyltransferase [Herbiconiux daphne]MCS5736250.1 class I SAM-dependent methyltransferase [Herbiconiux daphne]